MNWRTLISASLLLVSLGCSTAPVVQLIPNDRFLEPAYDQEGTLVQGRSSIADGYLREIEQRLHQCQSRAVVRGDEWAVVSVPPDNFKCTVRGTVYAMDGKLETPYRTDGCTMIGHRIDANGLTLTHGSRWVLIAFPLNSGHTQFTYRWGSVVATVAGKEVPVAMGGE